MIKVDIGWSGIGFYLHKKEAYHVPGAPDASSPLTNVRNVHENSFFISNISIFMENVNIL